MKGDRKHHRGYTEGVAFANEGLWENQGLQKKPLSEDFLLGYMAGCEAVVDDALTEVRKDHRKKKR